MVVHLRRDTYYINFVPVSGFKKNIALCLLGASSIASIMRLNDEVSGENGIFVSMKAQ